MDGLSTPSLYLDDHRASFLPRFLRYFRDNLLDSHVEKLVNHVAYIDALILEIAGKSWNSIVEGVSRIVHFCRHWSRFKAVTMSSFETICLSTSFPEGVKAFTT